MELFKVGHDRSFQAMEGFYQEKNASLDAVYIGSSNVHSFWEPPVGWNDHGIAVWSLSMDAMPVSAVKHMIAEARKTQPDALYIININGFKKADMNVNYVMIHRVADYMRFSLNKIKEINWMADRGNIPLKERLEFIFPIIRFHARWNELDTWDFTHSVDGLKKGIDYGPYLSRTEDLTKNYRITDKVLEPDEDQIGVITDILDYCDAEKVNTLFVFVPQAISEKQYEQTNAIQNIIRERGYPCWDLLKISDEIGIQPDTDFYNAGHTNVHGSMKFIDYFGDKLVENYHFIDKKGQPGWESWDKSVQLYTDVIGPYTLPIERNHELRDYELEAPSISLTVEENNQIELSWSLSDGAEFYTIFRKSSEPEKANWDYLTTVNGDVYSFIEDELDAGVKYTYTIVPGYVKNDLKYYGKFDFIGVAGKIE